MKSNGWTPERRARQAALIRSWRPWEKSTGPRTLAGKAVSSRNADTGKAERMLVRRERLAIFRWAMRGLDLLEREEERDRRVMARRGRLGGPDPVGDVNFDEIVICV